MTHAAIWTIHPPPSGAISVMMLLRRQSTAPSARQKADAAQSALLKGYTGAVAHRLWCLSRMTLTTFTALPSSVKYAARALETSAAAAVTHAAPAAAVTCAAPAPVANVDLKVMLTISIVLGFWGCGVARSS